MKLGVYTVMEVGMKLLHQVLNWTTDTHLFEMQDSLQFERGVTKYILHNYPDEFDLFSFSGLIYPANSKGELLDLGDLQDKKLKKQLINVLCDYFKT